MFSNNDKSGFSRMGKYGFIMCMNKYVDPDQLAPSEAS